MVSCKSPYEPREDSTLLERYVGEYAKGAVLDMGTGSGIQAIAAAQSGKVDFVIGADVLKSAIDYCKKCIKPSKIKNFRGPRKLEISGKPEMQSISQFTENSKNFPVHRKIKKFLVSDMFDGIKKDKQLKNEKFDTIIFNPPYLPDELKVKDLTLEGGKKGYEVIERFLSEVNSFLTANGVILIVFSSLTKKEKVDEFIRNNLLEFELLEKQHYFFEDLYVYKIKKSELLKELEAQGIKNIKYFAKGKRGLVFTANYKGKKIAVKINNPESKAAMRMENEAKFLKLLNKKGIGPKLLLHGNNFLAYGFVEGVNIIQFLSSLTNDKTHKKIPKNKINKIIIKIIEKIMKQLYAMDKLRINKQEMSHPQKHIIINKKNKPMLIDFERCKYALNPGNVTQFCDFLTSGHISNILSSKNILIKKDELINAARLYRKNQNNGNYKKIIKIIENG